MKRTAVLLTAVLLSSIVTFSATKFIDVNPSDWFYNDVIKVSEDGIMSGYKDGSFKPNQSITRAEMAVIVNRLMERESNSVEDDSIKMIITARESSGYVILPSGQRASCVFVAPNLVLTAKHVTDLFIPTESIQIVTMSEGNYYGTVIKVDSKSDLSLVKLNRFSTIAPIKIASSLSVLEDVYAFGAPSGLEDTITFGKVSTLDRVLDSTLEFTQFDIQCFGGSSGGAIVNSKGELVSIASRVLVNTTITFGARIENIIEFLKID